MSTTDGELPNRRKPGKCLLVMRHAKSSWAEENTSDHDRKLNKRGKRTAPRVGEWLVEQQLLPQLVFCSTAKRASETAKLLTPSFQHEFSIDYIPELYLAPASTYIELASTRGDEAACVLMIGHNPGIESLAGYLVGSSVAFPTAALLIAEFDIDRWNQLSLDQCREQLASPPRVWRPKEELE